MFRVVNNQKNFWANTENNWNQKIQVMGLKFDVKYSPGIRWSYIGT